MCGVSSIQIFLDFWNFFNFAKPLIDEAILSKYAIFVLFIAVCSGVKYLPRDQGDIVVYSSSGS